MVSLSRKWWKMAPRGQPMICSSRRTVAFSPVLRGSTAAAVENLAAAGRQMVVGSPRQPNRLLY